MHRYNLVTSPIVQSWPKEGRILFLGKWCLDFAEKKSLENRDFAVAKYHWDDRKKLEEDFHKIKESYEYFLNELSEILNNIHGTNHSVRYWRILLGWWLFCFISVIYDRWQTIKIVEKDFPDANAICISRKGVGHSASNSKEFMNLAAQNEDWNETVYSQLIRNFSNLEFTEVEIVKAKSEEKNNLGTSLTRIIREFWTFAKKYIVLLTNNLSKTKLFYGNGISMESTYLSRWNLFKFFLLNRQLPTRKVFKSLIDVLENPNLRNWNLEGIKNDEFAGVLSFFIPKYLPRIYLESFNENKLRHQAETKSSNPKILVTGNDFSGNEAWAFWSADLMEKGSKIYIAQHGGFYGTALFCATQEHEISISDKFLSWGWTSSEQSRVTPAPAMKLLHNKNRRSLSKTGPVLLLGGTFPQYSYHLGSWPIGPQFHKYFDDQFSFVSALSSEVKSNLNVRLHPADSNWRQGLRWKEYDERIKTENGSKPFSESLKGIRLSISTYNATTFLETFNRNIPTVIFWDQNYWELNDSARSHFDELIRAKILFTDPAECADHVNSIFNDTISWWQDNERQQIVRSFLHKFGYCPKFPMTKLAKIVNAN